MKLLTDFKAVLSLCLIIGMCTGALLLLRNQISPGAGVLGCCSAAWFLMLMANQTP